MSRAQHAGVDHAAWLLQRAQVAVNRGNPLDMLEDLTASGYLDGLRRRLQKQWSALPSSEVDECVAQAVDAACAAASQGRPISALGAWLWKTAANIANDRWRADYSRRQEFCDDAADADFCVISAPGSPLAAHYIRAGAAAPSGSAAAALGACLAGNARDPASFLARRDGSIILEYDVPAHGREEPPPPGIFFVPRGPSVDAARKLLDDPAAAVAALWAAAGSCADPAELREVERVYEVLADAGLLVQAGVLPGRPRRAVRLVVHGIDTAALSELLDRLRWPGSAETALSVTAATNDLTLPGAVLSLDVSARGVSPRLGLELFRPAQAAPVDLTGWRPMIERLTDRQWCLPAKAEGLRAWPRTERVFGPHGVYRVYQYINHIKAVVDHDRIVAKAYVAMVVRRFDG